MDILDAQVGPYGANLCSTLLICGLGTLHLNDANSFLIISNGSSLALVVFGHVFVRKILTSINRKSIQHPLSFFPKTLKNPPGGSRNPSWRLAKKANVAHNAIFSTFLDFRRFSKGPCAPFGLQNLQKIETKSPSQIFSFCTSIFRRFFTDLASQKQDPNPTFLNFFRKRRFCEIVLPCRRELDFRGSGPPKIDEKTF